MTYEITIEQIMIDPNEQDSYRAEKRKKIYSQIVEDLDIVKVIAVINGARESK